MVFENRGHKPFFPLIAVDDLHVFTANQLNCMTSGWGVSEGETIKKSWMRAIELFSDFWPETRMRELGRIQKLTGYSYGFQK